jgi:hypothetical protein
MSKIPQSVANLAPCRQYGRRLDGGKGKRGLAAPVNDNHVDGPLRALLGEKVSRRGEVIDDVIFVIEMKEEFALGL